MKKVLILAYDFPPFTSVGGLRPYGWYSHLKEFGITPIIITRQWKNTGDNVKDYISKSDSDKTIFEETELGLIIKTPYNPSLGNTIFSKYGNSKYVFIRKFLTAINEYLQYVLPIGTKRELYKEAKKYLSNHKVDAIIATGDPFILFQYATKLSKQFDVPSIVDYRDLWSNDISMADKPLFRKWLSIFEKKVLKKTTALVTVSEFLVMKIHEIQPVEKNVVLRNGFDEKIFDKISNIPQNNEFLSIGFVGSIYEWHPIESFMKVVLSFLNENKGIAFRLNFYGVHDLSNTLKEIVEANQVLKDVVSFYPRMSNEEVLIKLKDNNVLLLFNYYCFLGTKIFDYLALNRKILFCYTDDVESNKLKEKHFQIKGLDEDLQEKIIIETQSGIIVKDSNQLKIELEKLYENFKLNHSIESNSINTEKYSRRVETKKLADLVKELSA